MKVDGRLGVGFIGSGFMTRFHLRSWVAVRDADVLGVWSPTRAHRRRRRHGARARCRRGETLRLDHGDGRRPGHRLPVDRRTEPRAPRLHGGDRPRDPARRRHAARGRLREAARPQRRRGAAHARAGARSEPARRLSREPGVRARGRARARDPVGARRERRRTALPRARRRGAQRPAQRLVLARRPPGRRCAVRHDVPLGRGRAHSWSPIPAKPRTSLIAKRVTAQMATLKWSRPEYVEELRRRFGAEVDYQRRPAEDFAESWSSSWTTPACRSSSRPPRRGASSAPAFGCRWRCSAPSTRCAPRASTPSSSCSSAAPPRRRGPRTWSRSRTPRRA